MKHPALRFLLIILAIACITACSSKDDKNEKPPEPVEKMYNDALAKLQESDYKEAIKKFEDIERQYSYSPWALRAEIMSAHAAYRDHQYDNAITITERFVKQHPNNINTPYAYYLKAICYYDQITDVGRDQKITDNAKQALKEVISRFPDTEYAHDAKIKLDLVIDHLAGKEMEIGRYYETREEYLAAINRFRIVVEKYQTTTHTAEALHRLVECYLKLGIVHEAQKYAAVLGYNYPGSDWYKATYAIMNGEKLPEPKKDTGFFHKLSPF